MEVQIPENTTSTVFVPADDMNEVRESGKLLSQQKDINVLGREGEFVKLKLGSGLLSFYSFNPS